MTGRTELPSGLVTFMFTDIEGSTRLARMLGEGYSSVLDAHRDVLRAALRNHCGVELFTEGDSFFVAFGNATDAVAACVASQRALAAYPWPGADAAPKVRMGLHTGWAVPRGEEYTSTEVHRAARVAAAAHGGQILCSESTALAVTTWSADLTPAPREPARTSSPGTPASSSVGPAGSAGGPAGSSVSLAGRQAGSAGGSVGSASDPAGSAGGPAGSASGPAGSAGGLVGLASGSVGLAGGSDGWAVVGAGAGEGAVAQRGEVLRGLDLVDLGLHILRGFDDQERLFQVLAPGLERVFPRPRTPGAPVHNLPAAVTPFVGRQNEVAELRGLVGQHRIVTVVGGGGTGKSRLAFAAAEEVLSAYPEGVWVVDLVEGDAERALGVAMGVRREPGRPLIESVVERCGDGRMLVVLDTCDADPGEARRLVRQLLAACPRLDVLATSRVPVGVPGELVWRIPALLPADSYALLSARADAARGGRPGPADELGGLAQLASRLEGHPLAIELAAQRLRVLSAGQLAARLEDPIAAIDAGRVATLAVAVLSRGNRPGGPWHAENASTAAWRSWGRTARIEVDLEAAGRARHESLTANLDWSYLHLSRSAAELLRWLAVFAGPVELSAVEWSGEDAFGALSELAEHSLVEVVSGPRYRLPRQVRSYATGRLMVAGEDHAARDNHVAWALHVLEGVLADAEGQPRAVSLNDLSPYVEEWENALRWSVKAGSARAGLRLAAALDPWWREHGGAAEGRERLYQLYSKIDAERAAGVETVGHGELASAYLMHAGLSADRDERSRFLRRAEAAAQRADDAGLLVRALAGHRVSLIEAGMGREAEQLCREVIATSERAGVSAAGLPSVVALAELLWRRDALDEAADLLGGARATEACRPEDRGRRTVDWMLGMVALRRGDLVAAHDHLVVALRSRLRHGFRGAAADAVAAIAVRCALGGDPVTAAMLFGGTETVRGARRAGQFAGYWTAQQGLLRATLGDAAFDGAYAEGAEQGFTRAVATALAVEHPDLAHDSTRFAHTPG